MEPVQGNKEGKVLELDYGDLTYNIDFVDNCEDLKKKLIEVQKILAKLLPLQAQYSKLPRTAKIELDLFILFALNSLQWIKLQIKGVDPSKHPVKAELQSVKAAMMKWQQYCDEKNRPKLDIPAVRRFIKGGLHIRDVQYHPYKVNRQTNDNTNQKES